jgi:hypothetical protein
MPNNTDLNNRISASITLSPATRNVAGTGGTVDLNGFGSAAIEAIVGTVTDGTHSLVVQESDDGTTWANVNANDLNGSFSNLASNTIQEVGYMGTKRFIRVNSTSSGTTGAAYSVIVIRGNSRSLPI